ncbi:hypothetical protein ACIBTV_07160 [Micromonospora sp. NPDC049366]|uniref:hypothetical protein n=1 Tax=Micromonospora sp. NPDC049366 TaxID=3364271 RepID=UPI0037995688
MAFDQPLGLQAALDYQDRHPQHHRAAPPDPVFPPSPQARRAAPVEEIVPPELSNDPLVAEGAWS